MNTITIIECLVHSCNWSRFKMEKAKLTEALNEYMTQSETHSNHWVFGKNRVFFNETGKMLRVRNDYCQMEIDIKTICDCMMWNDTIYLDGANKRNLICFNSRT